MTTSSHCPQWCTARHHLPDDLTHARDIAELGTGRFAVSVEISQPGHIGDEVVNIFAHTPVETEVVIVAPELAASIGRVLLELDDSGRRALARALSDAAGVLFMSRATTSADPRSAVEREAAPNTSTCEATPHTESTDGR